jgi:hypothetical protein
MVRNADIIQTATLFDLMADLRRYLQRQLVTFKGEFNLSHLPKGQSFLAQAFQLKIQDTDHFSDGTSLLEAIAGIMIQSFFPALLAFFIKMDQRQARLTELCRPDVPRLFISSHSFRETTRAIGDAAKIPLQDRHPQQALPMVMRETVIP